LQFNNQVLLCADINGAVKDLASLHEQNYIRFCLDQLNKWLQLRGPQSGLLEDTCLTRLLQNPKQVDDSDEDSLLRYNSCNSFSKNVHNFMTD